MLPLTTDKAAYFSSQKRGKIGACHSSKIESAEAHIYFDRTFGLAPSTRPFLFGTVDAAH